jgi:hypothetical protein
MRKSKIQGVASTRAMHRQRGLRIAMAVEPNRIGEKQKNLVVLRIGQKGLHVQLGTGVAKQPPAIQGVGGLSDLAKGWGESIAWGQSSQSLAASRSGT